MDHTTNDNIITFPGRTGSGFHHHAPLTAQGSSLVPFPGPGNRLRAGQYSVLLRRDGLTLEALHPLHEGAVRQFRAIHWREEGWHVRNADGEVLPLQAITEEFFGEGVVS